MQIIRMYLKSYGGLTQPAWMLAFVILINRSGAMVLPFLSLYLKDDLDFQAEDVALMGGILASTSYRLLFYVNGITCLLAAIVFALYFYKLKLRKPANVWKANRLKIKSPFRDMRFIVFALLTVGFGTVFFQFLFTLPVY